MASPSLQELSTHIRRTFAADSLSSRPDRELLSHFLAANDPVAFEELVRRHGPMVLAACRRVLTDPADADDVFQAAFLTLLRCGGTIHNPDSVGSWLFGVAHRLAVRAKHRATRRREVEQCACPPVPRDAEPTWREAVAILHEELDQLPDRFRLPLLLCYLDGLSRDEAAVRLGWKSGSVKAGLERGRNLLRTRLARRGIALSAGLLATLDDSAAAGVRPALIQSTLKLLAGSQVTPAVLALARGAFPSILAQSKLRLCLLASVVVLAGVAGFAGGGSETPPANVKPDPPAAIKPAEPVLPTEPAPTRTYRAQVIDSSGKPVAGAVIRHQGKEIARSDGRGRFEYTTAVPDLLKSGQTPLIAVADGFAPDWAVLGNETDLTLRMQPPVTIRGRLLDLEGRPIVEATVRLHHLDAEPNDDLRALTELLKTEPYKATTMFRKQLSSPVSAGYPETVRTDSQGNFEVRSVGKGRMVGLVPEADGFERVLFRAIADETFDPKVIASRVPAESLAAARKTIASIFGPQFTHTLRPTQPVIGTVRDAVSKKPLAGVEVSSLTQFGHELQTTTDAQGHYRLIGLPKLNSRGLRFKAGDDSPFIEQNVAVPDIAGLAPIKADIDLIRGVRVSGRVTDRATGRPVRAMLQYYALPENKMVADMEAVRMRVGHLQRQTDEDGRYRMTVPHGPGAIFAQVDRVRDQRVMYRETRLRSEDRSLGQNGLDIDFKAIAVFGANRFIPLKGQQDYRIIRPPAATDSLVCDFQFTPGLSVPGVVHDPDGKSLTGVVVSGLVPGWDKPVNVEGASFVVRAIDPARPRLVAFAHAGRKLSAAVKITGTETDLVVRLQADGVVTGRILDRDGSPRAGAQITIAYSDTSADLLRGREWSRTNKVTTGADGRFRLEGVIPGLKFGIGYLTDLNLFEGGEVSSLKVDTGETRDLGDLQSKPFGQ